MYADLRRHALQRRLLLRLRQRRDATAATTATAPWRPSTSATSRSGATARATAPGSWPARRAACYSGVNAASQRRRPDGQQPVTSPPSSRGEPNHWAIRGGNAQSGSLSTLTTTVQRPSVAGYNPMTQGGRHHPGHRRRQQRRRRRYLLRGRDDLRLPVRRHRERGAGQHRGGRVRPGTGGGTVLTPGSTISLRATTACCTTRYHAQWRDRVATAVISSSSTATEANGSGSSAPAWPAAPACPSSPRTRREAICDAPDTSCTCIATAPRCSPRTRRSAVKAGKRTAQGNSFRSSELRDPLHPPLQQQRVHRLTEAPTPSTPPRLWSDDVSWVVTAPLDTPSRRVTPAAPA